MRDELSRQYRIIRAEFVPRILMVGAIYALCALYVDAWVLAALYLVELAGEFYAQRLLLGLDPLRNQARYRAFLLTLVPMTGALVIAAGLVFLEDDPYAKSLAVGIVMGSLLHLCSVRSIHLPHGSIGMATVGLIVVGFNTAHWLQEGSLVGLALSSAAIAVAFGYSVMAMVTNNRLHRAGSEAAAAARAANVAKGRFLAQISHELRTPLNAVIGLGEIEAATAKGASRQRLQTVVTSARDLSVMLDDAVDYSALTEGRVAVTQRPVTVRSELSAHLLVFELQARRQGRELRVTVDKEVPQVVVIDSQRVRQCLGNLIGNALKHSSRGIVSVTMRHVKSRLIIDVSDQGKGIPAALHEQIFEPFFRGSNETPGVGLGLSISRAVARQMGGDLVLLPSVQGSLFRLTVPAPEAQNSPEPDQRADFRNITILVVDDIATNRLVASQLLASQGARVIEAASGQEALDRLAEGGIDAVLLDLMMPGMDGAETLRRIRSAHGQEVAVVAMTADVLAIRSDDALRQSLDGYLLKPILPESLRDTLAPVLQRV